MKLMMVAFLLFGPPTFAACGETQLASAPALTPLTLSQELYAKGFEHVSIQPEHVRRAAALLARTKFLIAPPLWDQSPYPPRETSFDRTFEYFLILHSINYMFVSPKTRQLYGSQDDGLSGAALLAERLTQHIDAVTARNYLRNVSFPYLRRFLGARPPIPSVDKRVGHLRGVGRFLDERPINGWRSWLKPFPNARTVAEDLAQNVPGFNDPFLNRAQSFVSQLVSRYQGTGEIPLRATDLDGMSVSADNEVPMTLWRMKILEYTPKLARKIAAGEPIPPGSPAETEIRAATIVAGDLLFRELRKHAAYREISIRDVDALLHPATGEVNASGPRMPAAIFVRPETPPHLTLTTHY